MSSSAISVDDSFEGGGYDVGPAVFVTGWCSFLEKIHFGSIESRGKKAPTTNKLCIKAFKLSIVK